MPLDRINGEPYDDRPRHPATQEVAGPGVLYGARYVVIEPNDLFRHDIRVEYRPPVQPGKFRSRKNKAYRHISDDVIRSAGDYFIEHGAIVPLSGFSIDEDEILVQVYPDLLKVVVHVQRMIAREEKMVTLVYPPDGGVWPPDLIRTLLEGAGKKPLLRH